ncbi:hypothetical protein GCM10023174_10460 [Chelativorans composti]|uniref:Uncharacterized protein n=1 Tax=Chelativorans composti TaxID=768533 RepID=A0ABW5DIV9_9HYPH
MTFSGHTLVVHTPDFNRSLFDETCFDRVTFVVEKSLSHVGRGFDRIVLAGYTRDRMPSEKLFASIIACVARSDSPVLYTIDGRTFTETPVASASHPLMQFFGYGHLPEHLQVVSRPFCELALHIVTTLPRNSESTTALRKLLEAKDCAVRAVLYREE